MHRWFNWFGQPGTFVLTVLLSCTALVLALAFPAPQRWLCLCGMLASTAGDLINTDWRGIGKKLMAALEEEAEKAGCWTLFSVVFEVNKPSLALHEACGFRTIGYRERIAKDRFGNWQNTIHLEKRL